MKIKGLVIAAAVAVSASSAFAKDSIIEIHGAKAKELFEAIENSGKMVMNFNTIDRTQITNGNGVTCTLIGSHGGSPSFNHPEYLCDIEI